MKIEISTLELLLILAALETAATEYESEANRTSLADIRRTLLDRAEKTRGFMVVLKARAVVADKESS